MYNYNCIPTTLSDHFFIDVTTHSTFTGIPNQDGSKNHLSEFDKFDFHDDDIDWASINNDLNSINWQLSLKDHESPDAQYNSFLQKCLGIIANKVPLKTMPKKRKTIPRDRCILMRRRKKLLKKISK